MTSPKLRLYHRTLIAQHIVIMAAVIFLCVGAFFIGKQVIATLVTINTAGNDVHETFIVINKPRTGTLAGLNQAIFGVSGLMKQANGILNHEEKQLSTLDKQEAVLFMDLHTIALGASGELTNLQTLTTTLNGSATNLNTALVTANSTLKVAPALVTAATTVINDTDKKINDPAVTKTMNATADIAVNVDGITDSTNKIGHHLEQTIDNPHKSLGSKILEGWNVAWQILELAK